jgi:integrase
LTLARPSPEDPPIRGHHQGSIFQRRGHWHAQVTLWDGRRSRQVRADPWDDSEAGAREKLRRLLEERDAEVMVPRKLTLRGYLERWLADMEPVIRPNTAREYRRVVGLVNATIGSVKLSELRPTQIERALAGLSDTPRTALHAHNVLRGALNDAVETRLLIRSPMAAVRVPRVRTQQSATLTADQAARLIAATAKTTYGPLWALLLGTGTRINEALGITWGDVDFEAGALTIAHQLTRRGDEWLRVPTKAARTLDRIALPAFALDALREQRRRMLEAFPQSVFVSGAYVFLTSTGHPVRSDDTIRELHRATDKLGLPRVTQHAMRHTSLTLLADAGVPEDVRQRRAGHSTTSMARKYTSGAEAQDRTAADALNSAIGGSK